MLIVPQTVVNVENLKYLRSRERNFLTDLDQEGTRIYAAVLRLQKVFSDPFKTPEI